MVVGAAAAPGITPSGITPSGITPSGAALSGLARAEPAEEGVDGAADERDPGPDPGHDRVVQDGLTHDRENRSGHDGQRQRPEDGPIDAVVRQLILVVRHRS